MSGYCDVIVEIAHAQVAHVFTYRVPEDVALSVGSRVLVPFGPRRVEGYVLRLKDTADMPPERVKNVLRTLEAYPALLPELIGLAEWMTGKYHCLLVESLRLMIPAQMRGERVHVKTQQMAKLLIGPEQLEEAMRAQARAPRRAQALQRLMQGACPVSELSRDAALALAKQGLVEIYEEEQWRRPEGAMEDRTALDPPLMPAQERVLNQLIPALGSAAKPFLLQGVTGSGKTEVYIRLIREVLKKDRTAIVLVPEIALTPQMVGWFRRRFGEYAAVLHSGLSVGERYDEWRRIRLGEARVVIGARSAVFAPVRNLGAIIVDEEHEQSYVSDKHPRYDAREVARRRCDAEGGLLLLASATPAIADFARAMRGDLTLLEMPTRVMSRAMPTVELVDMREELARGNRGVFSGALMSALRECMDAGRQAMLFINRRGHSTFVSCRACGYVVKCDQCDVSMTYHLDGTRMRCHYCNAEATPPQVCPKCASRYIKFFGAGTQKVEEEVAARFPGVPILRMDNDTTRAKNAHALLLERFRKGEARIMIGTQMIAKGLDFPNVTVVGVVAADAMLQLPDYRSPERTFQLITQVAGRAGRADAPGRVVVQTYDPTHYSIVAAAAQDFRAFYEQEFQRRRHSLYPPFTHMVRILFEGEDGALVQAACEECCTLMEQFFEEQPQLRRQAVQMRAMEAPLKWIRGRTRWQLFLKLYARGPTKDVLDKLGEVAAIPKEGVEIALEIDPANMI